MNCINEFTCSLVFGEFHQSEVPERDGWTVSQSIPGVSPTSLQVGSSCILLFFINLFIFGCVGSSLLCAGFL